MKIDYEAMTEDELIAAVSQDGDAIRHIDHPSEAVCMAAVMQNGLAVRYIQNPSEAVQLATVRQDGWAIQHIQNPSEEVQLAAVNKDAWELQDIKNPSEAVCMAAVNQNLWAIGDIQNPSEAVQVKAIQFDPDIIIYLPKPYNYSVSLALILNHPLYQQTPKEILDRAPELLEAYCAGLEDVYLIGRSMAMTGDELSRTMREWIESHHDQVVAGDEMSL